jgi:hypothetical protein
LRGVERLRVPEVGEGDRRPQPVDVGEAERRRPGSTGDVLLELLALQPKVQMELVPHAVGLVDVHLGHPGGADDSHDRGAGVEQHRCPGGWRNPLPPELHGLAAVQDGVRKAGAE